MATVYSNANRTAGRHVDTVKAIRHQNTKVEVRATVNLAAANKTSRITPSGYFPASIETAYAVTEYGYTGWTILHAPNAMALEFGHQPSGWFAGTDTKPPDGEYILTDAAYGGI